MLDLSDNAFGPTVAPTLVKFLNSPPAFTLQVLNLNNEGLGINGGCVPFHSPFCPLSPFSDLGLGCAASGCGAGGVLGEERWPVQAPRLCRRPQSARDARSPGPRQGIQGTPIVYLLRLLLTKECLPLALQKIKTLEEVSMPQNGIYPAGIEALSEAFAQNPGMRRINLSDNTIKVDGAAHLHQVSSSPISLSRTGRGAWRWWVRWWRR